MDAAKRIKNLKDANWSPPLGGSFAKLREDLKIKASALTASDTDVEEYFDDDTVLIDDGTS